jgi:hypothetical protein
MTVSVEYTFVIEIVCCLWHGHWCSSHSNHTKPNQTLARARALTSFCIRCGGREGGIHGAFYATNGFSPLSDICDGVVVSGGEYCWRVALFGFEDFYPVMKWK